MAYQLSNYGSYGSGAAGAVTDPATVINAYANVTAISGNTITIGTAATSTYSSFAIGQEILLHVSAQISGTDGAYLGHYQTTHITGVSGSVLTLDNPVVDGVLIALASLANYVVQAVAIPSFTTFTLTSATLTPLAYAAGNKYGGIIALKATTSLVLNGGKIDLSSKGIPTANKAYRILDAQETQGIANTAPYSGWENHITSRRLYLNSGDGTAFILVANLAVQNTASRIGYGAGTGAQYTRSAAGGPVILLAAGTITGFVPAIISTQPSATGGQGLGRCYIASETKLVNDEGLYAKDVISNPNRIRSIGITDYGKGNFGAVTNPTVPLNNYAAVTAIDSTGKVLTVSGATSTGLAQFTAGVYVLFQAAAMKSTDSTYLGTIFSTQILAWDGTSKLTLKDPVTNVFPVASLSNYACQIIAVPDFTNLTISTDYNCTPTYANGQGGVCALLCNGTLDLTNGGKIDVMNQGNSSAALTLNMLNISNSGMKDCLPVGTGHGSIFIVANTAKFDTLSRLGAIYDGSLLGGSGGMGGSDSYGDGGSGGGNGGGYVICPAGTSSPGGANLFLVFNTLSNFNMSNFSTGGYAGYGGGGGFAYTGGNGAVNGNGYPGNAGNAGGAGYGGGGGGGGGAGGGEYNGGSGGLGGSNISGGTAGAGGSGYAKGNNGGSGGGTGYCFLYVNTVTSSNNYAGTLLGGTI